MLARKTVPIVFIHSHVSWREIYAKLAPHPCPKVFEGCGEAFFKKFPTSSQAFFQKSGKATILYSVTSIKLKLILLQKQKKGDTESGSREKLPDADGKNEVGKSFLDAKAVGENERNDQGVGEDGRDRHDPLAASQEVAAEHADKGSKRSKNNIKGVARGKHVRNKAADGHTGYRGRRKIGEDAERLRYPELNGARRKSHRRRNGSKDDVKRRNNGRKTDEIKTFFAICSHFDFYRTRTRRHTRDLSLVLF